MNNQRQILINLRRDLLLLAEEVLHLLPPEAEPLSSEDNVFIDGTAARLKWRIQEAADSLNPLIDYEGM